jgi:hypothetical protein
MGTLTTLETLMVEALEMGFGTTAIFNILKSA